MGPMTTLAQIVAPTEDRWPSAPGEVPDDALGQVLLASHLLGSDRAVANFGGGNTSAKGTATDHVGREVEVMWVKGSGSDLLAGTRDGERLIGECFGEEAAWIPYIRPGFTLAKQVGTAVRENPELKLIVLAKHGLVVWGETAEEAYRRTIEVINRAAEFVNVRTSGTPRFDGPAANAAEPREDLLRAVLPALRGA